LARCQLAFFGLSVEVSDFEEKRVFAGGKNFTYEMLKYWQNPDRELFFFMGSDCLPQFHDWHRADELSDMATFVSIPRTGISSTRVRQWIANGKPEDEKLLSDSVLKYIEENGLYKLGK